VSSLTYATRILTTVEWSTSGQQKEGGLALRSAPRYSDSKVPGVVIQAPRFSAPSPTSSSTVLWHVCLNYKVRVLMFTVPWEGCFDVHMPQGITLSDPLTLQLSLSRWGIGVNLQLSITSEEVK
jgi:hypothetical protein